MTVLATFTDPMMTVDSRAEPPLCWAASNIIGEKKIYVWQRGERLRSDDRSEGPRPCLAEEKRGS